MRIADLRIHPIAIADPPLRSSYGLHAPYALRTIVELVSDDGAIGISETYGGEAQVRQLEALRERIIGANPYRLTGMISQMVDPVDPSPSPGTPGEGWGEGLRDRQESSTEINRANPHPLPLPDYRARGQEQKDRSQTWLVPGENPLDATTRTFAAIEVACLDLIGKSVGQPVCDLIGGRVRDEVPFSAYPFYKHAGGGGEGEDARGDEYGETLSPEALVSQVQQMVAKYGFTSIKFKAGVLDPDIEIETIKQLYRALGPNVPLRIDPNSAWTVETSVRVGKALAVELGRGGYLEDPTAGMENMSEVRKRLLAEGISTPLASNVAVTCFADIPRAVALDAVQIILCDHHYWGGMRQVQHLARLANTFGIGLSMHSNSHLGVSLMAMAHCAAATPHLTYACDTHYPWAHASDEVVLGGRVPIVNGCVKIPDKPGLGVELDYDQLARGRERYDRCAYRKRDDEVEMRKHVDPNWKRVLPRW